MATFRFSRRLFADLPQAGSKQGLPGAGQLGNKSSGAANQQAGKPQAPVMGAPGTAMSPTLATPQPNSNPAAAQAAALKTQAEQQKLQAINQRTQAAQQRTQVMKNQSQVQKMRYTNQRIKMEMEKTESFKDKISDMYKAKAVASSLEPAVRNAGLFNRRAEVGKVVSIK